MDTPQTRLDRRGSAIERDPEHLDELVRALGDPNEAIRYWGAQEILMLGDAAESAVPARNARLAGDRRRRCGSSRPGRSRGSATPAARSATSPRRSTPTRTCACAASSTDEYVRNAGRYLRFVLTGTYTPSSPVFGGL